VAGEGEFDFIARRLAPLTRGQPGAYGLKDDGAILVPSPGQAFAVTSDTLVEGVHFPVDEDPFKVAWKALAANVSDLVAMGAEPKSYLLNVVWPRSGPEARMDGFVDGLAKAQDAFGLTLAGGDTTSADGPWTISMTAMGEVPRGRTPRRGGARADDILVVTNQIGDAWLGLELRLGAVSIDDEDARAHFDAAFSLPFPPVALCAAINDCAHAAIDVSDGLLADLGHILSASGLRASVDLQDVPVSNFAKAWLAAQPDEAAARLLLATGGDDYEVIAAIPEDAIGRFEQRCEEAGQRVTRIGVLEAGEGLQVTFGESPVETDALGFTHF